MVSKACKHHHPFNKHPSKTSFRVRLGLQVKYSLFCAKWGSRLKGDVQPKPFGLTESAISPEIPDLDSFWDLPSNGEPPWPSYVPLLSDVSLRLSRILSIEGVKEYHPIRLSFLGAGRGWYRSNIKRNLSLL
jgi:hypothetical protein